MRKYYNHLPDRKDMVETNESLILKPQCLILNTNLRNLSTQAGGLGYQYSKKPKQANKPMRGKYSSLNIIIKQMFMVFPITKDHNF